MKRAKKFKWHPTLTMLLAKTLRKYTAAIAKNIAANNAILKQLKGQ